ncbi:MAG: hypothetical protein AVDCRST_MAG87-1406, partial [uncultured Thermomicrobiales bacterium]
GRDRPAPAAGARFHPGQEAANGQLGEHRTGVRPPCIANRQEDRM